MISAFWYSHLLQFPHLNLFLTDRVQQWWWDGTWTVRSWKMVPSSCCTLSLLAWLKQAAVLARPSWPGSEGGLRPAASKKLKPSVQKFPRNWIPTYNLVRKLSSRWFPSQAFGQDPTHGHVTSLRDFVKQRNQLSHVQCLTHSNCEIITICCFKVLTLK